MGPVAGLFGSLAQNILYFEPLGVIGTFTIGFLFTTIQIVKMIELHVLINLNHLLPISLVNKFLLLENYALPILLHVGSSEGQIGRTQD